LFWALGEPGEIDKTNSSLKPQDLCLRLQILMASKPKVLIVLRNFIPDMLKNMVLDSWRFLTSIYKILMFAKFSIKMTDIAEA